MTRSPLADDPRARSADLDGPVHHQVHEGPAGSPPLVLVHGLGGTHLNWSLVAPGLARRTTVRALDLPGFGGTEPEGRSTTVQANAALLVRFLREIVREPVVLVGNSMGGMVSILATAAAPELVRGLVLVDPCSTALPRSSTAAATTGPWTPRSSPRPAHWCWSTRDRRGTGRRWRRSGCRCC